MSFIEDNIIEFMNIIDFINKFLEFITIIKFNDDNDNFDKIMINHCKYINIYINLVDYLDCFR